MLPCIYNGLYYKPVLIHENVLVIFRCLAAREALLPVLRTAIISSNKMGFWDGTCQNWFLKGVRACLLYKYLESCMK